MIVRLEDAAGSVGWGEAAPVPGFGSETADEDEAACRAIGDRLTPERLNAVPGRLSCLHAALRSASDCRPDRWSGCPTKGRAYSKAWAVAALLPAGRAALGRAGSLADAGFRVFKWKVGIAPVADELGMLDDLLAALPSGARLRLDANGAWDRRSAERWLERCAGRPIEHVEQPVPSREGTDSADLLRGLAADYPTPIALDESLAGDGDVERWLGLGWKGVFVVKPSLLGNAPATMKLLEQARAAVVFSSALETAVGARAALRTAFSWPGETRALGFGVWPLFGKAAFDGPPAAPFLRESDVERLDPEAAWNALS